MSQNDEVVKLRRKRGGIKKRVTEFTKFILEKSKADVAINKTLLSEIEIRFNKISGLYNEFSLVQDEIDNIEALTDADDSEMQTFEAGYFSVMANAQVLIDDIKERLGKYESVASLVNSNVQENTSNNFNATMLKLPVMQLPKFTGKYTEWLEFRDAFESIIHESQLTKSQKFFYLKTSLEGDVAKIISSMPGTADNYDTAWNLLCDRYENRKLLAKNHFRELFELPTIKKESSHQLRAIVDTITQHLRSLQSLGLPVENWDAIIIHLVTSKLDLVSQREWETTKFTSDFPTLQDLKHFLLEKAAILDNISMDVQVNKDSKVSRDFSKYTNKSFYSSNIECYNCKGAHTIYECKDFISLSVNNKINKVRELKLCQNCLRPGHMAKQCNSSKCRRCRGKHNTLLHTEGKNGALDNEQPFSSNAITLTNTAQLNQTLLSTAIINIQGEQNSIHKGRVLFDSGSQSNFITEDLVKQLKLSTTPIKMSVSGITNCITNIKGKCRVKCKSQYNQYTFDIDCLIVPDISECLPQVGFDISSWNIPSNIQLADPNLGIPSPVDILLGVNIFWELLQVGRINLGPNKPIMQRTKLGWIVAGSIGDISNYIKTNCHFNKSLDIQEQLAKFWEIEECPTSKPWSEEECKCETHFVDNLQRESTGRFVVSIPFKNSVEELGDSKAGALRRFYALERRLQNNPQLKQDYCKFMREYKELGHMSRLDHEDDNISYFLPHHGVVNEASLTTKLRVVFDGSHPSSSGLSLNNLQMVGPTIQSDLLSILLRFRQHSIAISADIEKMYRQVLINPKDRSLQRIIWRAEPSDPISVYQLNTVTYGTAASAFLSTRCLHQLAAENQREFPIASKIIMSDFYVDDLLTGAETLAEATTLCQSIRIILEKGCFTLRKWISSNAKVLETINYHNDVENLTIGINENIKTLGLLWNPRKDMLIFMINPKVSDVNTKRTILSIISQIFDPLGMIGAYIIIGKIILQLLWQEKLHWDDPIPRAMQIEWTNFREGLHSLNELQISRRIICDNPVRIDIHGFADASERAYGACIYLRSEDRQGSIAVNLLCSKAKVAPIKTMTMPRLELMAAFILAKLVSKVQSSLRLDIRDVILWTDSSIVLAWIKTPCNLLKIFVANRVSQIQELTQGCMWRHVPTSDNPADLLSRGVDAPELIKADLWWSGPTWLPYDNDCWPSINSEAISEVPESRTCIKSYVVTKKASVVEIETFSSYTRLQRVMAYCLRFMRNCGVPREARLVGPLSPKELFNSTLTIVKMVQQDFAQEIKELSTVARVSSKSKLVALSPFLDDNNLLRVGGRIPNADLPFETKHQLLLPAKHHFTVLLFRHEHIRLKHAGAQQLLATIRDSFWPLRGRNMARQIVHQCVRCCRVNPSNQIPIMGSLPRSRTVLSFPFEYTGVDYAGPFLLKTRSGRGAKTVKCYIALFVCFASKAVHIELATDLTSEAFLAALRRFVARRGRPKQIHSDNGTNLVGANNTLKSFLRELATSNDEIERELANEGISWSFIPAHSPNFGGLWEAGIKRAKFHLLRIMGNASLTYEEFNTLVCQVEAILNSRPLFPMSDDPNDFEPLTPSHFLIGRKLTAIAEPNLEQIPSCRLKNNFARIQQLQQHFWRRWTREYLNELQPRRKWKTGRSSIGVNSLVLVQDDNRPPLQWALGRVVTLHPGANGINRVATVKTTRGSYTRAISKLYPLPTEPEEDTKN